jgi:hypothetical protein
MAFVFDRLPRPLVFNSLFIGARRSQPNLSGISLRQGQLVSQGRDLRAARATRSVLSRGVSPFDGTHALEGGPPGGRWPPMHLEPRRSRAIADELSAIQSTRPIEGAPIASKGGVPGVGGFGFLAIVNIDRGGFVRPCSPPLPGAVQPSSYRGGPLIRPSGAPSPHFAGRREK